MGVDASAIGGLGYGIAISTDLEFYIEKGIFTGDEVSDCDDDELDSDTLADLLEQKLPGVSIQLTYGYEQAELFPFVGGQNIEEMWANAPLFVESMKRLGYQQELKDIKVIVISFFS